MMIRVLLLLLPAVLLGACGPKTRLRVDESPADKDQRIAIIGKIIERSAGALPGEIIDAHYVQVQLGDGVLGPSDFQFYAIIELQAGEIEAWKNRLKARPAEYAAPLHPPDWWIAEADFQDLETFAPKPLFGQANGWVVFQGATLYAYTFTL